MLKKVLIVMGSLATIAAASFAGYRIRETWMYR